MITASWRDPSRLSDRARSWLIFMIVSCAALIFLAIWVTYAATHVYDRFEAQPAGSSVTVDGNTYRLVKLTRTDVVVDGDETKPASAHATWVIAELELTIPRQKDTIGCSLRLLAEGKRQWDAETFYDRRLPNYCGDSDHPITPGKPWRFEQIYEVPTRFADRIQGIAVTDHSSSAAMKVLLPAG
jgi:hypothetical protein